MNPYLRFTDGAWNDLYPLIASFCDSRSIGMFSLCCKSIRASVRTWYDSISVPLQYHYVERGCVRKRYKQSLSFQHTESLIFVSLDPATGAIDIILTVQQRINPLDIYRDRYWVNDGRGWEVKSRYRNHLLRYFGESHAERALCCSGTTVPFNHFVTNILYERRPGQLRKPFKHTGYYLLDVGSMDELLWKIPKKLRDEHGNDALFIVPIRLVPK